jgi:hypothetical protein
MNLILYTSLISHIIVVNRNARSVAYLISMLVRIFEHKHNRSRLISTRLTNMCTMMNNEKCWIIIMDESSGVAYQGTLVTVTNPWEVIVNLKEKSPFASKIKA